MVLHCNQNAHPGQGVSSFEFRGRGFVTQCDKVVRCRGPEWAATPLIYLPQSVSDTKAGKLRQQGAQLVLFGEDAVEAEREARQVAAVRGMTYVSPYNDPQVL